MALLPHVRLVPDDPVADAAAVLLGNPLHERAPVGHARHRPRPVFGVVCGPGRRTDQDGHHLPAGSQLGVDQRIGHIGRTPIARARRLHHVPPQDDPGVPGAELGGGSGIGDGLDDPEAGIGRRRLGITGAWTAEDRKQHAGGETDMQQ